MIHTDGTPTIAHRTEPMAKKAKPERAWDKATVWLVTDTSGWIYCAHDREDDALELAAYLRAASGVWTEVQETTLRTRNDNPNEENDA